MNDKKLAKASASTQFIYGMNTPDYLQKVEYTGNQTYHEIIKRCRFFYEHDPIAGTVINRMADIAITELRNRHDEYPDTIKFYYDGVARILARLLRVIPLSYLIDGMAIPDYKVDRIMGNRIDKRLGRTRYIIPKALWVRDNERIVLKKTPTGDRSIFLKIPKEDIQFIESEGKPDRVEEYNDLVALYPEYVRSVKAGNTTFKLQAIPIFRKLTNYNTYPLPFLKNALGALDYRRSLKRMDKITAERVIAAIRQISVGNDEYPADDEDIQAAKNIIQAQNTNNSQDSLLNVYTNHTIKIQWIVPPMDNIIDSNKYIEANSDVFLAMGFPRLWAVGENERSNSSDNKIAAVSPIATLEAMRKDILEWIRELYRVLAEMNGFLYYPDPYWTPISSANVVDLLQYAAQFIDIAISKDTVAQLYGTSYDQEQKQINYERSTNTTEIQEPRIPS